MELRTYLTIIWRRKGIIALTLGTALIVTVVGTLAMTPMYAATTTLRIATPSSGFGGNERFDTTYGDRLMNTYIEIATSTPVLVELAQRLNVDEPPKVEVTILANTELVQITVEDPQPVLAAQAANTLAEIVIDQARRDRQLRTNPPILVELASVPLAAPRLRQLLIIALGMFVGLIGGLGLAFLFENLDTTLYTTEQIETVTELTTLGKIPVAGRRQSVAFLNGSSPQGEAFRRLRTTLLLHESSAVSQALLITSAEPGEGKSTIVANLAYTMAQSGRKVVIVDCDLRLPTQHSIFHIPNTVGLSNVLKQEVPVAEALQSTQLAGIQVLTSGTRVPNPAEVLSLPTMPELVRDLKREADIILFDSPALAVVVDAAIVAPIVDSVILVVGRAKAREEAVVAVRQQLAAAKVNPIGLVVNRAELDSHSTYYDNTSS